MRCGLCEAHDAAVVRSLLACSERWANILTAEARDALERERNARIVQAREAGETIRSIAVRENLTSGAITKIEARASVQHSAGWKHAPAPPPPRPIPPAIAALDRPAECRFQPAPSAASGV